MNSTRFQRLDSASLHEKSAGHRLRFRIKILNVHLRLWRSFAARGPELSIVHFAERCRKVLLMDLALAGTLTSPIGPEKPWVGSQSSRLKNTLLVVLLLLLRKSLSMVGRWDILFTIKESFLKKQKTNPNWVPVFFTLFCPPVLRRGGGVEWQADLTVCC